MLTIEVTVPRALSYKGRIHLQPGTNEGISEKVLLDVWKSDKVMRFNYADGHLVFKKDGQTWSPEDAPEQNPVVEVNPIAIPSAEVTAPEDVKEPEPREPQPESEPTPLGGGSVPGNATQAKQVVAKTGDSDLLSEWLENESRATIRKAIKERLEDLKDAEG